MFGAGQACIYETKQQSRCLEALVADSERHRFLVGTSSVKQTNEIHVLEYDEDMGELSCQVILSHPNEVCHLAPHPRDLHRLFVCENGGKQRNAVLYNINGIDEVSDEEQTMKGDSLEKVTTLGCGDLNVNRVIWNPVEETDVVVSMQDVSLKKWCMDASSEDFMEAAELELKDRNELNGISWDPHNAQELALGADHALITWDSRSSSPALVIEHSHHGNVRDVDYNPNKPHHLVSSGEDRCIRFWDLRNSSQPLKELSEHTHWIWAAKFNRFHDQLVLSAGSDSAVNLWRVSSISSAPLIDFDEEEQVEEDEDEAIRESDTNVCDALVRKYEDHEDSVYSLAWGSSDTWIFATLSYDGRVALNQVPSSEKYKILL